MAAERREGTEEPAGQSVNKHQLRAGSVPGLFRAVGAGAPSRWGSPGRPSVRPSGLQRHLGAGAEVWSPWAESDSGPPSLPSAGFGLFKNKLVTEQAAFPKIK